MATAREIIKSALRKILSSGDTNEPTTSELADGLEGLNDFLENLAVDGVRIAHQTLTLDDTVNVDKAHIRTIKAQLAVELAPEFGSAVDPQVAFIAQQGMKALRADTKLTRSTPLDSALVRRFRRVRW